MFCRKYAECLVVVQSTDTKADVRFLILDHTDQVKKRSISYQQDQTSY